MNNIKQYFGRFFSVILFFYFASLSFKLSAQLPSCDGTVPFYSVNLTGQPAGSWLSPQHKRDGSCCGQPANCTSFEVTLDSNAAALSFQFYSGAVPTGSLSYQINCGPSVPVGQPICISGVGPHRITFCKPGSNTNEYLITSIAKPTFPQDDSTRNGCSKKIEVLGLDTSTVTWQSIYPGAPGNYDNLLSCTSNCTETYFTPQITSPPYIDYVVCGFPQADECGYVLTLCDTFRIYTMGGLTGGITPNPAGFCQLGPGSGVTLTAQGVGGNNAYNYTWYNNLNNVVGTGPTFFATTQQTYTVEIKDGLISPTCASYTTSVPVVQTSQPTVNAGNDQLLCPDISEVQLSGSVNFATGGKWTGGAGSYAPSDTSLVCSYTPTPAEIASGTLSLYLTSTGSGGSCTNVTDTVVINFPDFLQINLSDTLLKCNQSSVVLNPNVTGGVTPYNYIWSNGTSGSTTTVGEGTYCLTIVDDLGCSHDTCVTVSVPLALSLSMSSTAATTNGGTDGSATASPSGGTLPYNYLWNPAGNTATINGLGYGIYSVTVIDGNGCNIQGSVVVSEPRCLGFGISTIADTLLCYGDATATATALPVGGTAPYVYLWDDSSSSTTQSITNLTGGLYSVIVSDSNNCLAVSTASIEEPTKLVNAIFSNNATVVGGTDGSATANTFGGEPPYTYSWSTIPTQNGTTATGLSAGVYYVTITDKNNCSILDSVLINEPPCNNYLLYVSGTNLSCEGSNNGTANVVIVGGTSPYNILWSNTQTTAAISGLSANTYTVEVTDAANCYSFKNITITEPNELQVSANLIQDMSCFGTNNGTVDLVVVGGTYPYTYLWSNGSTAEDLINLPQGNYSVLVTDNNGCTANDVVTITQPALLTSNYTKQNVKCYGDSTGSIDVTPIGGTSPYTYLWSNGATTQDVINLTAGLYNYTVYDANSCNSPLTASILISEPDLVELDSVYIPCPVAGSGVSIVEFYPVGGTPSYQTSIDSGLTYSSFGHVSYPSIQSNQK
ncbi:MAG: SprB repeat-containing protein [Flavobacteriales bacterium]